MDLLVILTLLIIIISSYLINKFKGAKPKLAPLVRGGRPLIGHLPILTPPNLAHIELANLADKYGPIFTLRLGVNSLLVVSSFEILKEIYTANDANVSFRPSIVAAKHVGYEYAFYPFTPTNGLYWREVRKFSYSELLSNRRLELLKYIRVQEMESSINDLWRNKGERVKVEMKQWLLDLNLNVLLRMVVGKKSFDDEKERREFKEDIKQMFGYLGMLVLRDIAPILGWIDAGGHEKRMKKLGNKLDDILGKWLEEHKKKRLLGEDKEGNDFMDSMISFLDGKHLDCYDADTAIKATCLALIAGYETETVALSWAVSLLLNNKDVMKKAQEELDTHVGKERMVNDKDISKLVYLQAIVKESLRLHPPAFIPGPRKFINDCTIGGYHIPKGTWLMMNLWKMHRDPNVWSDPLEFKPERFLTTHKGVDVKGQHFELLPFGGGRRECPAKSYGLQMMHFTLATLLHSFEMSTPNDEPVDMSTSSVGLTNARLTNLDILVSPRLPSCCFEKEKI